MKKVTILMLNALLLLTGSCGIYRKYERPENMVTDSLFGEKYDTTDTTSMATMSWEELFTDPDLQALIQKGLDSNTDLRSAELRVEAADSIQPGKCPFKFADREDKCYNGDEAKWVRFANTLRLRLALRISNIDPEWAQKEGIAALNHPGGIMLSQDDRMKTIPNYAPIDMGGEDDGGLENEVANCGFRYSDVVMSLDMEQAYKNLGSGLDPRCRICWYRPTPKNFLEVGREMNTDYKGCAIGDNNISHETNVYSPLKCNHHEGKVLNDNYWFGYCREYIWLGYAECKFLLAEARLREWTYAYGSVEELFKEGIRESFNYYNMPDSAETYINRLNIYNGTQENPFAGNDKEAQLEQIITQKWLAVFPNGNEGWRNSEEQIIRV